MLSEKPKSSILASDFFTTRKENSNLPYLLLKFLFGNTQCFQRGVNVQDRNILVDRTDGDGSGQAREIPGDILLVDVWAPGADIQKNLAFQPADKFSR